MKIKKIIFSLAKILVIIISIGYIIFKVYSEKQNGTLFYEVTEFNKSSWLYLFAVAFLVPVNWVLESLKFKLLVINLQVLPIKQSVKAVLTGITVSIFTPKRIGDFGGRILFLENKNRIEGVFATLLGSVSQLLITLIVGGVLFPIYLSFGNIFIDYDINIYLIFFSVVGVILIILFVYLNISSLGYLLGNVMFFKKHNGFIIFLQKYNRKELVSFLIIGFARYIIFTFQFVLLLWVFGVDLSYFHAIIGISQIYFLMLLVPTFALGELGVRGSLAAWVLSIFTSLASGVIAASMLLWIVNLAVPAIVGAFYLSKINYSEQIK